ncbi:MAG: ABC transporter substrate-binding protein [Chromatiaceae bacterium]|jgi:phospholipid transport system substrate-binding protein|nr:ABC transporter substrate-binding protein [Chromatiaceae bacterium]
MALLMPLPRALPLRSRGLAAALFTAALLVIAAPVQLAANEPLSAPQQVIQQVSDGLMRVLREDRSLLQNDPAYVHRLVDELFLPHVDFDRVSALVLGPHWRQASQAQRAQFREAFKGLLIHTYASALNELSEWQIRFPPERPSASGRDLTVRTQVMRPGGEPIDVDYRMHEKGGQWLAFDVSVAGVSLLNAYRSTFTQMARERGIDGLIAELETRNAARRQPS